MLEGRQTCLGVCALESLRGLSSQTSVFNTSSRDLRSLRETFENGSPDEASTAPDVRLAHLEGPCNRSELDLSGTHQPHRLVSFPMEKMKEKGQWRCVGGNFTDTRYTCSIPVELDEN